MRGHYFLEMRILEKDLISEDLTQRMSVCAMDVEIIYGLKEEMVRTVTAGKR
jgi:hypothetical protein